MTNWNDFYEWLQLNGYHIYRHHNIFRNDHFIYSFDDMADADSGEIEATIATLKELDINNFKKP